MDKKDAIYTRTSSTDQSVTSQLPDLERWAAANGVDPLRFTDAFTGTKMARPGLDSLLAEARAGRIGRVIVWRLDRLGRTALGLLQLMNELQSLGVGFVSVREGIDLATPAGRLLLVILAGVAAFETEVRAERQRAGIAAAKANGKTWGGSKKGQLKKATKNKAKEIERLAAAGVGKAAIARAVGLSRPTIYKLLGNDRPESGQASPD